MLDFTRYGNEFTDVIYAHEDTVHATCRYYLCYSRRNALRSAPLAYAHGAYSTGTSTTASASATPLDTQTHESAGELLCTKYSMCEYLVRNNFSFIACLCGTYQICRSHMQTISPACMQTAPNPAEGKARRRAGKEKQPKRGKRKRKGKFMQPLSPSGATTSR